MTIQPGTDIGRYHILEQLGEGGMAVVYKAYDTRLENDVAIKIIRVGDITPNALPRILTRFSIEAKKMAQLTHPNIVKVMDYGDHQGAPFLVMPYLPGGTLKTRLGEPLSISEAVNYLLPIARALEYAHKKGLVHRDIKPANILITENGEPMLSDFGVAKILDNEKTQDLTVTGMGVGTPEYMAPEMGTSKDFDHRVDIYALGIVLYEMITGRKPFTADTPIAVLLKQSSDPLPRPSLFVSDISESFERVLFKALAKDPDARYGSMAEFANGMKPFEQESKTDRKAIQPIPIKEPTRIVPDTKSQAGQTQRKPKAKKPFDTRWLIGAMGAIGLGLVIFAGIKLFGNAEQNQLAVVQATDTRTETPIETPTEIPERIISTMVSEKDGMTLVYVPEGEFEMGSEDGDSDEQPVHTVFLDAFWIDQTEVTNAQYELCVSDGSCDIPNNTTFYNDSEYSDHPVVYVNWYDASDYCEWAGRRLPTEAQWEKAARGMDGRTYPWGEDIDCSQANYYGCSNFSQTSPVGYYGEKGASPYGAYDMAGNAWEWVADWYADEYYQNSPSANPTGPNSGSARVVRGGSWFNSGRNVRSAPRDFINPDVTYYSIGFRCAHLP